MIVRSFDSGLLIPSRDSGSIKTWPAMFFFFHFCQDLESTFIATWISRRNFPLCRANIFIAIVYAHGCLLVFLTALFAFPEPVYQDIICKCLVSLRIHLRNHLSVRRLVFLSYIPCLFQPSRLVSINLFRFLSILFLIPGFR